MNSAFLKLTAQSSTRRLLVTGSLVTVGTSLAYRRSSLDDDDGYDYDYNHDLSYDWKDRLPCRSTMLNGCVTTECSGNQEAIKIPTVVSGKALPSRSEQLERLRSGETFDIIVVGGGATGSGAALDAATRGLNVALIDRGDFGSETSSRSTKLIWAGIKYIATAFASLLSVKSLTSPIDAVSNFKSEVKMLLGLHKERRILLENNPHLTNWVPIAVPFSSWLSWPPPFSHALFSIAPLVMPAVMKVYDGIGGFTCPPSHVMGHKRARRKFPQLTDDAKYFQIFYEGQHNDARTNTCIALTAAEQGATIANYVEMIDLIKDKDTGKAVGIRCRDNRANQIFDLHAKAIVFCGGPFTDSLRKLEDENAAPAVAAAAGTHIVLPKYFCPGGIGILDINTSDGRFLFFLPWQGHTLVGTTDRKEPANSEVGPPEEEIEWLLNEVQKYLAGEIKVRRSDVLSAWQGYRPLASDPHALPGDPVSRDHIISTNPATGVTFITGGKWSTYREMAEDVIDKVIELHDLKPTKPSSTETLTLRGGEGYTRNLPVLLVQQFGISETSANHLARTYGMNAFDVCGMLGATSKRYPRFGKTLIEGFPYLECEVSYICRHEMVCTVKDMLTLRMRIAYLNKEAAIAAAPRVAELMAKELNWSRWERKQQLKEALDALDSFGGSIPNKVSDEFHNVKAVHEVFEKMDLDGSGYIDFTEFKDCCKLLGIPFKSAREAQKAFDSIDSKRNGKIDENEFQAWWHKSNSNFHKKLANKIKFTADAAGGGILG